MNILIDIRPLLDKRYSGVAEYTVALINALLEIDQQNHYFLFYNSFKNFEHRLPNFSASNVTIVKTKFPNKVFNYLFLKLFRRPYFDRLAGEPINIVFLPHLNFGAWSRKTTSVVTVHDLSFIHYPEFFSLRKNIWHTLLGIRKLLRRANHVITLSENTKQDIISYANIPSDKVSVVYSGVGEDFKKVSEDDENLKIIKEKYNLPDAFILFLGTVEPRKNLMTLISTFEVIRKQADFKDFSLVIAGGRGWKSSPIYKQAQASYYAEDIIFLDYIPAAEKVYLYNLATVFIYPSFYEGFGFPPLEAMACGTPTIVSAVSSLPEVVEDATLMVDPYNMNSMVTSLITLLGDRNLYEHYSVTGQKQAQKFLWSETAKSYLQLFEHLHNKS